MVTQSWFCFIAHAEILSLRCVRSASGDTPDKSLYIPVAVQRTGWLFQIGTWALFLHLALKCTWMLNPFPEMLVLLFWATGLCIGCCLYNSTFFTTLESINHYTLFFWKILLFLTNNIPVPIKPSSTLGIQRTISLLNDRRNTKP